MNMKKINFNVKGILVTINSCSGNDTTNVAKVNTTLEYDGEKMRHTFYVDNGYNWYTNSLNTNKVIEYVTEYFDNF